MGWPRGRRWSRTQLSSQKASESEQLQWQYAEAAFFFDTQDHAIAHRVRTDDELEDALAEASDREALVLIELVMSRLDAPGPLVNFAQTCAEFNFPQFRHF